MFRVVPLAPCRMRIMEIIPFIRWSFFQGAGHSRKTLFLRTLDQKSSPFIAASSTSSRTYHYLFQCGTWKLRRHQPRLFPRFWTCNLDVELILGRIFISLNVIGLIIVIVIQLNKNCYNTDP